MRDLIDNMDSAYDGNRKLTDMRGLLDSIQLELDDYINTKDESGLNKFYKDMAEYKIIVESLKHEGELTEQEIQDKEFRRDIHHKRRTEDRGYLRS